MIKSIMFDFDGTLAECKLIHFESLNKALEEIDPIFKISNEDHIKTFDGLSTKKKLNTLISTRNFPKDKLDQVFESKQKYTIEMMDKYLSVDTHLINILNKLSDEGYKLLVVSNAIRATLVFGLNKLGIRHLFNKIISNEDVEFQKPHPQIYLKAMVDAGVMPNETLIIEDSKHGRMSAILSGAHVCGVDDPTDLTEEKLYKAIKMANCSKQNIKWAGKDINIVIPMSGKGSRFSEQGFTLPKPLIPVFGKPMIQTVVDNLNIDANFFFIVQKEHSEKFNLKILLPLIAPGAKVIETEGVTQGAACSVLLAKEFINNNKHLIIVNSDQFIEWSSHDFIYSMLSVNADGGILTFPSDNPKWSFAKINDLGFVTEVAEKKVISNLATVGLYYYKHGKDFVSNAEEMINQNVRVNNEFYVCPVYNFMIANGKKIKTFNCEKMWGLGTPEDLQTFLNNYKGEI